jgi:chromosome segregation ATPase
MYVGSELKLILSLTDRVKALSTDLESARLEREDIAANLQSAETVRDFLIDKLKGAEVALKSAIGEIGTLKRQAESDQEVIAYLDLRTNELECEVSDAQQRFNTMRGTIEVQSGAHSYMERLLTNEVADYKHRLESAESTFKLQKKVLAKEVKALRARMASISSELEYYQSNMIKFREALNSTFTPKRS